MQQRQEIVGYRSSFNQMLAHIETGTEAAIISMQGCRLIFNWLRDPYYNAIFSVFGICAAITLTIHAQSNFGAENLAQLQEDGRQNLAWLRERRPQQDLPAMCLFSSPKSVYNHHQNTILVSALIGAVLCKLFDTLINEGVSTLNGPFLAVTISLLIFLLVEDFVPSNVNRFDEAIVPAEIVLTM